MLIKDLSTKLTGLIADHVEEKIADITSHACSFAVAAAVLLLWMVSYKCSPSGVAGRGNAWRI
jgi:hypothetical protein